MSYKKQKAMEERHKLRSSIKSKKVPERDRLLKIASLKKEYFKLVAAGSVSKGENSWGEPYYKIRYATMYYYLDKHRDSIGYEACELAWNECHNSPLMKALL